MTVAFLDIRPGEQTIANEDVTVKLFPSKEAALEWFKKEYEPDEDYCEAATDFFNEQVEQLTAHGSFSDDDGYLIIKEVE